jgi:hypothetical protein
MRRVLPVALLALVFAAPAEARWPKVERAQAIAVAHWGAAPDCRVWTLKADDLTYPTLGWATRANCTIRINRWWYDNYGRRARVWPYFCSLYLHEWGHLLGHAHSDDPEDVMYPTIRVRPACR